MPSLFGLKARTMTTTTRGCLQRGRESDDTCRYRCLKRVSIQAVLPGIMSVIADYNVFLRC